MGTWFSEPRETKCSCQFSDKPCSKWPRCFWFVLVGLLIIGCFPTSLATSPLLILSVEIPMLLGYPSFWLWLVFSKVLQVNSTSLLAKSNSQSTKDFFCWFPIVWLCNRYLLYAHVYIYILICIYMYRYILSAHMYIYIYKCMYLSKYVHMYV